ncbi:HAD family hydrolase [Prevotella sp. SGI.027]
MDKTIKGKKVMKQNVKNIIFDLGCVLVGLDKQRCVRAFEQIGAENVASYVRDHRTADLFFDIETGQMTTEEFCDEVRSMSRCKAEDKDIVWAWNQLLVGIPDEKKQRLVDLKKEYRLFLLSNTNDMHWQKCANDFFPYHNLGVNDYFEDVYLSYKLQLTKPDRKIFETVLRHSQLQAAETLFIDDVKENCESATQLGIQVMHETTGNDWINAW